MEGHDAVRGQPEVSVEANVPHFQWNAGRMSRRCSAGSSGDVPEKIVNIALCCIIPLMAPVSHAHPQTVPRTFILS